MNRLSYILILVLATLLIISCDQNTSSTSVTEKTSTKKSDYKVYKHGMDGAPTTLDPVQSATVYSNFVVRNVYDTLYSYKYLARPYVLKPNLAVDMPEVSDDGKTYTIRIKPGVHYIDDPAFPNGEGREVIAEDFVYSIKRHFDPENRSQGSWLWQGYIVGMDEWKENGADYTQPVEGLTALDNYTIQIKLTKPYPQLTFTLAMGFAAFVPHEAVEKYGRELSIKPVGSGPFYLTNFDTTKAVMKKNPKFRQEPFDIYEEGYDEALHAFTGIKALHNQTPPFIDQLEIHFINESAARWNSFTKGNEIQYAAVPTEQVNNVLASKHPVTLKPEYAEDYHMYSGVEAGLVFTAFNMDDPRIGHHDDPKQDEKNRALRCAINKAFNWEQRNQAFYYDLGVVFPGVIPPVVPEFDPNANLDYVKQDLEGAKQLLKDHGWDKQTLPTLEYGMVAGVIRRQFYEQFRGWMQELGIPRSKIKALSYATFGDFNKAFKNRLIMIIGYGWGLDYPDAQNTLQLFYGPNASPGSNSSNYANPEFDALFEEASVMQPSPERTAIYQKMNQMILDDCVAITGLSRTRIHLWHNDVIALPDREILGGFFLKFVDLKESEQKSAP